MSNDKEVDYEIELIKQELNGIIKDLRNAAHGVRLEFKGIGNQECALALEKVADKYERINRKL